jgi:hypothetical protein
MESGWHRKAGLSSAETFWVTEICIVTPSPPCGGLKSARFQSPTIGGIRSENKGDRDKIEMISKDKNKKPV